MVSMTSSGGVPSSSVMIENWLTSVKPSIHSEMRIRKTIASRTVFPREQRLALEHLREYTARAPYVDRNIILLPGQHDLRGAVVSRRHVTRHLGILNPGEAKIADLSHPTYRVYEKVTYAEEIRLGRTFRSQFSLTRILLGFWE